MEGPFLAAAMDKYATARRRVAMVGQETNGWSSESDMELQLKVYNDFNLGARYYASPFWNVIRKLEVAIVGEPHSCAWLNLNRYD